MKPSQFFRSPSPSPSPSFLMSPTLPGRLSRRAAVVLMRWLPLGLLAIAAMAAGTANAAPGGDEPPLPQPTRLLQLPALHQQRLDNGLDLVVVQRSELPLISLSLVVRAGAEADPPGRPGVAAMTSQLWPKGARRGGRAVTAPELARQAEALGGMLEARSSWGASLLTMTVTTPRAAEALGLMADVLRQPMLAADELERARAQTLDALRVTLGNPADVAALALRRSFWGDVPHGRVAPPAAVQRLQRADLQAFQARWVRPDRVALVLVGDLSAEQGRDMAQRLLGDWRAPAESAPELTLPAPRPLADTLVLIDLPGSGQSSVTVAAPFAASQQPERVAALVANAVLGGGYSARLNQQVRIQRGLSYGASSAVESFSGGGMLSAQAQTSHANAAQVLQLLREQISAMATAPPSAEELAARQAALIGSFGRRLETTAGLSMLLVGQITSGRPLAELSNHVGAILAVTPVQVQSYARQHWHGDALRAVVVGDLGAAGAELAALAPKALRLTMAELDLEQSGLRKPR